MAAFEESIEFGGLPTKVVCIRYADRVFLTISQLSTFGTLLTSKLELHPDGSQHFNISTILGLRENDALLLICRRLAEDVAKDCEGLDLLLSVALKPENMEFEAVVQLIRAISALKPWRAPATVPGTAVVQPFTSTIKAGPGIARGGIE